MNITKDLKVEIQPRFEGATDPLAFYDVTGRVDADAFEFTSSSDGSTANADIGLYTLFPFSGKRWNEYAATEADSIAEALLDPTFRFEIPLRSEIKISQSYGDLSKYYAVTHYRQSGTTVTLTLNRSHTLTVGNSLVVTLAGDSSRSPNPLMLGGQRTITAVTSTTISYLEATSRTISQTAVVSGTNSAALYEQVTELLFGGIMMSVEEKRAGGVILQQVTCADYTALLDERVIDRYRVPQDTYGWEMIVGGELYEAGRIGVNRISISTPDVALHTFTQVSYDAANGVQKAATTITHGIRRNERFKYSASGYEYQVVGLWEDTNSSGIYYQVCDSLNAGAMIADGQQFKLWNHEVVVDSAEDHQLQVGQAFEVNNERHLDASLWNGIAKLANTKYIVDIIENSRKFFFSHRVATPSATASSPFTNASILSPFLASGYDPVRKKESTDKATFTTATPHGLSGGDTVLISPETYDQLAPWTGGFAAVSTADGTWYTGTVSDVADANNFQVLYTSSGGESEARLQFYQEEYPLEIQAITTSIFESIRSTDPYNENYDGLGINYLDKIDHVENVRYNPILRQWLPGYPTKAYEDSDAIDRITTVADFVAELSPALNPYAYDPIVSTNTSNVKHMPKVVINQGAPKQHLLQKSLVLPVYIEAGELIITAFNDCAEGDKFYLKKIEGITSGASPAFKTFTANENTSATEIRATIEPEDATFDMAAGGTAEVVLLPVHNEQTGRLKLYTSRHHAIRIGETIKINNYDITESQQYEGGLDNEFVVEEVSSKLEDATKSFSSISIGVGSEDPGMQIFPNRETPSSATTFEESENSLGTRSNRYRIIHARKQSGVGELTVVIAEVIVAYEIVDDKQIKITLNVEADSFSTNQVVRILGLIPPLSGLYSVVAVSGKTITLASYSNNTIFRSASAAVSGTPTWNSSTKRLTITSGTHPFSVGEYVNIYQSSGGTNPTIYREKIVDKTNNTFTIHRPYNPSLGSLTGCRAASGYLCAFTSQSYSAGTLKTTFTAAAHPFALGDKVSIPGNVYCTNAEVTLVTKDTVVVSTGANVGVASGTLVLGEVPARTTASSLIRYFDANFKRDVLQIATTDSHGFVRNPASLIDIVPLDVIEELESEGGIATILQVISAREFVVGADSTGTLASAGTPFDMIIDKNVGNFGAETSSALGIVMSRVGEGMVENEAITVSGVGGSIFDTSSPRRIGGIKHRGVTYAENAMSIWWEANGLVTLYFAGSLGAELESAFMQGRSVYLDISSAEFGYENKFAGIRTLINSGAVKEHDEHDDLRGRAVGDRYIQWKQDAPAASEVGAYAVRPGSVVSADVIEYVDTQKKDSQDYEVAEPNPENKGIANLSNVPISHWSYLNGVFRFTTTKKHKRKAGDTVYFSSIGAMVLNGQWNFNNISPTSAKKKITIVGTAGNVFGISVGDGSYKIKSIRCTNPTTDKDAFEVELSEDCAELDFPSLGFTLKGTLGSLQNINNLSGVSRVSARKFLFETQFPVSGILAAGKVSVNAGATITFKEKIKTAFATNLKAFFRGIRPSSTSTSDWSKINIDSPFKQTATDGTSEKNYVNDLKIPKGNGGAFAEMYYYEYLAKAKNGSYTAGLGHYYVTTDEPHNLGDRQPEVVFTPNGGSAINVSAIADEELQMAVTGSNTFEFISGSATVSPAADCTVQTRAAYVPGATRPTMPRNPDVFVGGRKGLNFVKSKWSLLRTDTAYPSFKHNAVEGFFSPSLDYHQWWTFVLRPNTTTSDMKILQRGDKSTYMAFGINSSNHPFVELCVGNTATFTKYPINNITIEDEEECVLQFVVDVDSVYRTASITAYKNFDESGTAVSGALYQVSGLEIDHNSLDTLGYGPGTVVVGAGIKSVSTYEEPFDGYIAEIIGFDRLPATSPKPESELLRAWLLHKYGLASLIDPDYEPDYRDINNVPNQRLSEASQVKDTQFGGRTLRQVLDYISKASGAQFWVNKNKELEYRKISTTNLVKNPMFENDRGTGSVKRWNGTTENHTLAKDAAGEFDRTSGPWGYGYAIKASGTSATSVYSDFIDIGPSEETLAAGDKFFVSAYVKSSDVTRMAVRVHFYSSATDTVGAAYATSYEDLYDGWCNNNEWRKIWKIVKIPVGSSKFTVGLLALSGATSKTHYWTDIRAVKLTGEFGFADEGNYSPNVLLLNNGDTSADLPIATYPFESPDNIRSAGASANRLYLYTTIPDSDENGIATTAISSNQELMEYTFDHVQGVWNSHGKIVEGSKAEEAAKTLKEVSGKASAFFSESGQSSASYQFEHPNNGLPGLLTPGSVVPYFWSEVDIWEPMIVKSQSTKLIGPEMYHTVTLQQEPDYQKNALVLIGRRTISVDLASAAPASERPPAPQRFNVEAKDPDGFASTIDTVFDLTWSYPFGDATTKGVEVGGFRVQVRKRSRALVTLSKKQIGTTEKKGKTVAWSASNGEPQTLVSMYGKFAGIGIGNPVKITGVPENSAKNKITPSGISFNGTFRVHSLIYGDADETLVVGFKYYVMTPPETNEATEETFVSTPAGYYLNKALTATFTVSYKKLQKGSFGPWLTDTSKTLSVSGAATRAAWDPSKLAVDPSDTIGNENVDQDYQFRIRAISRTGAGQTKVDTYSEWVQYPMADDAITIGGKGVL